MDAFERPAEELTSGSASAAAAVGEPTQPVRHSDLEIMGGEPVFIGTRVPVNALFDYLEGSHSLDECLYDFPSVDRGQALAALHIARWAVLMASTRTYR